MKHQIRLKLKLLFVTVVMIAIGISGQRSPVLHADSSSAKRGGSLFYVSGEPGLAACTLYTSGEGVTCRTASLGESELTARRDLNQHLEVISPVQLNAQSGLKIVLRATPQLENFPQAKAAFLRAAATWQSLIKTPITVIVDVDFGTTWFGQAYPGGILGLTNAQLLKSDGIYPFFKIALQDSASSANEQAVYGALPDSTVTTDIGDTDLVYAPSSLYRALGFIDAVADPAIEPPGYGPPPAVGFNAGFQYDFDPSDGIDEGKLDFDAVVTHELGHVLGFVSFTAQTELDPSRELGVTVWDLFRFRPGANMSIFTTAPRILSSGGIQVFFAGAADLQLSTGRPDRSGGDGRQASHWKDDELTGQRIGIMDPSLAPGTRGTITSKDIEAIDCFGYDLAQFGNNQPSVKELAADLHGDVLSLTGKMTDADGDVVQGQLQLLDAKGHLLGTSAPFNVNFGVTTTFNFSLQFPGLNASPLAMQAGLVLIDTRGNRSSVAVAEFSGADSGGPKLKSANFEDDVLKIKGKRMTGQLQIEINGQVLPASVGIKANSSGKKLTIEGSNTALNLRAGPNRVRVINDGLRSNLGVLTL